MAQLKLTKMELRSQQLRFAQLQKYLPTLQLKKALLQIEVNEVQFALERLRTEFHVFAQRAEKFAKLFTDRYAFDLFSAIKIQEIRKRYENIAGVEIPIYETIVFAPDTHLLFDSPVWLEPAILEMKELLILREKVKITEEKKRALEKELREVSIRVNLFEKILIPRTQENIKKIKVFLGDQQLTAVSQAKASKRKILLRQLEEAKR